MQRDFISEMLAIVDEAKTPYVPRSLATQIVQRLRAEDPELLNGWLATQCEHFLWQLINDRDRSRRAFMSAAAPARAFGQATRAAEAGDDQHLRRFLDSRYTVADGTRRPLAELQHPDLVYIADDYAKRERRNAFKKVFFAALAKKVAVGTGAVEDHFTEEQLEAMWSSLPN